MAVTSRSAQGEDPHGNRMIARRQPHTAATVATLVEAFLSSKEATSIQAVVSGR